MAVAQKNSFRTFFGTATERGTFDGMLRGDRFITTDSTPVEVYEYDGTNWISISDSVVVGALTDIKDALIYSVEANVDTGTATDGSTTTLEDTGKLWASNIWNNAIVEIERGSTNYITKITSHTADTLTFPAIAAGVQAGDKYWIKIPVEVQDIERWGGTALTGRDISLDFEALTANITKDTIRQGNLTLAGATAEQLPDLATVNLFVQANPENTGFIYVGNSSVSDSAHMAVLAPGSSVSLNVENANKLFVIGTMGDKVSVGGEDNV